MGINIFGELLINSSIEELKWMRNAIEERIQELREEINEEPNSCNLRVKIREIIKAQDKKEPPYITYEELKDKLNITDGNIGDLDEDLKRLLEDGEIYEPRPSKFRWLG